MCSIIKLYDYANKTITLPLIYLNHHFQAHFSLTEKQMCILNYYEYKMINIWLTHTKTKSNIVVKILCYHGIKSSMNLSKNRFKSKCSNDRKTNGHYNSMKHV